MRLQRGFDLRQNPILTKALGLQLGDEMAQAIALAGVGGGVGCAGLAAVQNKGPATASDEQPALVGEYTVGLGDGIEVDAEGGSELADRGEFRIWLQAACDAERADGVDDLAVDRDWAVEDYTNFEGLGHKLYSNFLYVIYVQNGRSVKAETRKKQIPFPPQQAKDACRGPRVRE